MRRTGAAWETAQWNFPEPFISKFSMERQNVQVALLLAKWGGVSTEP
jgi:hypothetical protein